jgi:fructose/tagatose bisphosphate aldolase
MRFISVEEHNTDMKYDIDTLVNKAVFSDDRSARDGYRQEIRDLAYDHGIYPASIQGLYDAAGKELYRALTVPAINIRGITYQVARAIFKSAIEHRVGAFIMELSRSEMAYTAQRPDEYVVCILAAAVKEGFRGPVFIQGDHFQINRKRYETEPEKELKDVKDLTEEAIGAGFYNIDVDASTLVDLTKQSLEDQQERNCIVTADITNFIRKIEPRGITISIGGEIGEVGKRNSTVADLDSFMSGYLEKLDPGNVGISKISIQTGTKHGGLVLPDGSIASVKVDFGTLERVSKTARRKYGMAGAVQHGASTLPEESFDMFPKVGTAEVHLATGFQNTIYDGSYFPKDLLAKIHAHLVDKYQNEKDAEDTEAQFIYKTRKKAFGDFKRQLWDMPPENLEKIRDALENRFSMLFQKLGATDTMTLVNHYVATH